MQIDWPEAQLSAPEGLLERAGAQWAASCLKVCVSQLHNDVAEALKAMGYIITIEQLTADKLFSIDIGLPGQTSLPNRHSSGMNDIVEKFFQPWIAK